MKRSPLRRQSAKKARRNAVYARSRMEVAERAQGRCEARIEGVCSGRHEHTHHRRLRSQMGSDDPSNLIAVCFACHSHIHLYPKEAAELGLIDFTLAEPLSSAVRRVERVQK